MSYLAVKDESSGSEMCASNFAMPARRFTVGAASLSSEDTSLLSITIAFDPHIMQASLAAHWMMLPPLREAFGGVVYASRSHAMQPSYCLNQWHGPSLTVLFPCHHYLGTPCDGAAAVPTSHGGWAPGHSSPRLALRPRVHGLPAG